MKKVLFISYYWPPSGKASLQWPLKIIKHLPSFDWQPSVLTVVQDTFTQRDETFLNEISDSVRVFKAKSIEPFNIYKKFIGKSKDDQLIASETISTESKSIAHKISIWLRMNLFIPDARVGWYLPAVKVGTNILNNEKVDAIVSIGPPHTTHLVGKKLSSQFNIPHIPVFIDPWVDISYYKNFKRSGITLAIDNHLEKSVLENAASIVFVTETMRNDYVKKYPFIINRSQVLNWGYSEEDFNQVIIRSGEKNKNEEIILHAGNIFDHQNPRQFWNTLKNEIDGGRNLKIVFIGTVSPEIKKSIKNSGLERFTEYKGFLPYKEMLNEMLNSFYLFVCATEPRHVPGKLFEYLRTGKPIIAFGDDNVEVKNILEQTNSGMIFGYDKTGKEFFDSCNSLKTNQDSIRRFERKIICKEMADILNSVLVRANNKKI